MQRSQIRSLNSLFCVLVTQVLYMSASLAQGRPDIVWEKGVGQIVSLIYSADGTLQAQCANLSSGGSMVSIVRSSDETVLHSYLAAGSLGAGLFGFAPNGQTYMYGDVFTNKFHCVRVSDGLDLWAVTDYVNTYSSICYTPDSNKVIHISQSGSNPPQIVVRNASNGVELFRVGGYSAVPSPVGSEIAVNGSGGTVFYDTSTWTILGAETAGWVKGYTEDGASLVIATGHLYSAIRRSDFSAISVFGAGGGIGGIGYDVAVRGRKAYVALYPASGSSQSPAYSWDIDSGAVTFLTDFRPTGESQAIAVSPDGSTLATLSQTNAQNGVLKYHNTSDGSLQKQADGPGHAVGVLAVAPNGLSFATGCTSGNNSDVLIWETATGTLLHRYPIGTPFSRQFTALAWAPDGLNLAVSTYELATGLGEVRIISPNDGGTLTTLPLDPSVYARSLHFTVNGKYLEITTNAAYGGQLTFWNRLTNVLETPLPGQTVYDAQSSPNDTQLALANAVAIYNWPTLSYFGSSSSTGVRDLAWSKDGSRLAYSLSNSVAYVLKPADIIGQTLTPYLLYLSKAPYGGHSNIAFDPANGRYIARGYLDPVNGNPQLGIFDTDSISTAPVTYYDQEVGFYPLAGITRTAYTPSGQYIIYCTQAGQVAVARNPFFVTPALLSLTITPSSIAAGATATGKVTLDIAAPPGGLTVNLANSNTSAATAPASVTVPAGATTATFTISGKPVGSNASVTVTASYNGISKPKTITVTPAILTAMSLSPSSVTGGAGATGTVTLSGNVTVDTVVTLSTTNPAAHVPVSVTIPAGSNTNTFAITSDPVTTTTAGPIKAVLGAVNKTSTFTVKPPVLMTMALNPTSVFGGTSVAGTVTLSGPVAADTTVTLASANAKAHPPASVIVVAGAISATFNIPTDPTTVSTAGSISASLAAVTKSATLTVKPAMLTTLALSSSSEFGGTTVIGTVTFAGAVPTNSTVTLVSTNANAHPPTSVIVPAGSSFASFDITTDPVTANIAGSITASFGGVTKSVKLTVKAPTYLSFTLTPNPVVGGNNVTGTVTMTGPVAVDTVVTLTNLNSKAILPSTTLTIPAGSASVSFTMNTMSTTSNVSGAVKAQVGTVTKSVTLKVTP